ncbi:unnamed protein product [Rotaria magnacalcarata]|uniref:Geminin n=1 Tax=Rotaria magnacalcarata TaxID=392030 RepID=A0A819JSD6_9BILA|nr:unnamed protein product [Rotaria magnacalcarata]CAF1682056.1 unnamed protein product [Rotaria magnacalcarata]CAF1952807.1 unnamed protein product [Rotaria magnacalcarata]CAF2041295.1 unnamed protein product [Rotaria magnacalcarata]CAF2113323.1 unnamed protein product [Rotaria magnacalcarata]
MPKRTSTPSKTNLCSVNSKKHHSVSLKSKEKVMCIQANIIEKDSKTINIFHDVDDIIMRGKYMNDVDFENFVQVHASTSYWKILAERTRIKLEEQLRENRQLHELYDELIQENEQLQVKSDKCEYLTNIFNSIMSEHDSGLELNITGESSDSKQEK